MSGPSLLSSGAKQTPVSRTSSVPASRPVAAGVTPKPPVTPAAAAPLAPPVFAAPTTNEDIINAIANTMQQPPAIVTQVYVDSAVWTAKYLGVPISEPRVPRNTVQAFSVTSAVRAFVAGATNPWYSVALPRTWNVDELQISRATAAQSNVLALIEKINSFASQAHAAGFQPPDNPFSVLASINAQRQQSFPFGRIILPAAEEDALVFNVKALIDLLDAFNQGGIDLKQGTFNTAQLSHIQLSFDGLGGSGNVAADLKTFLPSLDAQKKEAARVALEVLDFSKRVPFLLFTLDYRPQKDGPSGGTIIGFKKIADASGYLIKRRDVFLSQDVQFQVTNADVSASSAQLMSYARTYALSFLDKIDESTVLLYLDNANVVPDEYYIYRVAAYQIRNDNQAATFTTDSIPVSLTPTAKQSIGQLIRQMSDWPDFTITGYDASGAPIKNYNNFQETISPWPAFAQYIYGDSTYDWLLAAINIRASINRRDDRAVTRKYSYLAAHSDFLESQSDAGLLVKPADLSKVVQSINDSIQKFGVGQTIQNLLDETGISYYVDGRDPSEDPSFHRAGTAVVGSTRLFSVMAAAIDPMTATLDLKHLASNMAALLNQQTLDINGTTLLPAVGTPTNNSPTEIAVPDPVQTTATAAEGPLQFINKLGDLSDAVIDLTTFEGLSKLMRALRIISDFGPNRIPPASAPANVKPPLPPHPQ